MGWVKGKSGNPGGRPQIAKTIKAAGYDVDELRAEVIQQLVTNMRALDPADPKEARSWQFCVDRLDVRLNGPIREVVSADEQSELTDEQYAAECAEIAREHLAALTPEEKAKLLTNTAPSATIQ